MTPNLRLWSVISNVSSADFCQVENGHVEQGSKLYKILNIYK